MVTTAHDFGPPSEFADDVLDVVDQIPEGRVMTYGDIAGELAGHADLEGEAGAFGARLVGQVMARFGSDVPWWRVIRATGQPPKFHEEEAWTHYLAEGTPLSGERESYRIDLKRARYQPGAESTRQASLDL